MGYGPYGFMVAYLFKLKGLNLKTGSEIHPHTYLFRTSIKKSKKEKSDEGSVSSSVPVTVIAEKAKKKRKLVKMKDLPPLPVQLEELGSNSNEPLLKRLKKKSAGTAVEETAIVAREEAPTSQQPVVLPIILTVNNNNPTLAIMNVVTEVNENVSEEVNAPKKGPYESGDQALADQYNSMMEEPIARVDELETPEPNEEDLIKEAKNMRPPVEATRRSLVENYQVEGESSHMRTLVEEEEQVDFEPIPDHTLSLFDPTIVVLKKITSEKETDDNVLG